MSAVSYAAPDPVQRQRRLPGPGCPRAAATMENAKPPPPPGRFARDAGELGRRQLAAGPFSESVWVWCRSPDAARGGNALEPFPFRLNRNGALDSWFDAFS